jgi:hypothetical protein
MSNNNGKKRQFIGDKDVHDISEIRLERNEIKV